MLLLAGRVGSKLDYSKISGITGGNRHKIKDYVSLGEHTYFIRLVKPIAKGIDKELTSQPKVYFSDTGILNKIQKGLSSGHVFENAIANQLALLGRINFYEKSRSKEIDFILNENIAYEVKETPIRQHLSALEYDAAAIGIQECRLIGRYPGSAGFEAFVWGGNVF